jgi:hypothetical protein
MALLGSGRDISWFTLRNQNGGFYSDYLDANHPALVQALHRRKRRFLARRLPRTTNRFYEGLVRRRMVEPMLVGSKELALGSPDDRLPELIGRAK